MHVRTHGLPHRRTSVEANEAISSGTNVSITARPRHVHGGRTSSGDSASSPSSRYLSIASGSAAVVTPPRSGWLFRLPRCAFAWHVRVRAPARVRLAARQARVGMRIPDAQAVEPVACGLA